MSDEERREATKTVIGWLQEYGGNECADWWAWERTPMPCGLPSDEQLDDGVRLAIANQVRT